MFDHNTDSNPVECDAPPFQGVRPAREETMKEKLFRIRQAYQFHCCSLCCEFRME